MPSKTQKPTSIQDVPATQRQLLKLSLQWVLSALRGSLANWRNLWRLFWLGAIANFFRFLFTIKFQGSRHGGSGARSRSKYNAPDTVDGRYRRGNRRWSAYQPPPKVRDGRTETDFWTVIATVTLGCGVGDGSENSVSTYSCNCPDYARRVKGTVSSYGDLPASNRQFAPRTFNASAYLGYKSQWSRYMRAWKEFSRVEFMGLRNSNEFLYRIWTLRTETTDREWTGSRAGTGVDPSNPNVRLPCKHIWMVRIFRAEDYDPPLDMPESMEDY
jgi:hypothetical protein